MPIGKFSKSKSKSKRDADEGEEEEAPKRGRGKAPRKRKSMWAGVKSSSPKSSMPSTGDYRFRVIGCEPGHNPKTGNDSFKVDLEVVASDGPKASDPGTEVIAVFVVTGKGGSFGQERAKSFVMAAAGFEDDESYDEFDPGGEFIDSVLGDSNDYSDLGGLVDRIVDCRVTLGSPVIDSVTGQPTGDHYREYTWEPLTAEEQEPLSTEDL